MACVTHRVVFRHSSEMDGMKRCAILVVLISLGGGEATARSRLGFVTRETTKEPPKPQVTQEALSEAIQSLIKTMEDKFSQNAQEIRQMNEESRKYLDGISARTANYIMEKTETEVKELRQQMKVLEESHQMLPHSVREEIVKDMGSALSDIIGNYANRAMSNYSQTLMSDVISLVTSDIKAASEKLLAVEQRLKEELKAELDTVRSSMTAAQYSIFDQVGNTTNRIMSDVHAIKRMTMPTSCSDIKSKGNNRTGIYFVFLAGNDVQVYCDMDTDGGGWTMLQRRDDITPHVDFNRGWDDYKRGFGDLNGEFWLGLDNIHALTASEKVHLRVDLEDWDGRQKFAEFRGFKVGDEGDKYRLFADGYVVGRGLAGDSLSWSHSAMAFSTNDRDNDKKTDGNCAQDHFGGWWYKDCHFYSNLNGLYLKGKDKPGQGIQWKTWKVNDYSLKKVEMKIRRA